MKLSVTKYCQNVNAFSELKLVTDHLLHLYAGANREPTETVSVCDILSTTKGTELKLLCL